MSDAAIRQVEARVLSAGWGTLKEVSFELRRRSGEWQAQRREVYDRGHAAAVLLADPARGTVILTRQFRLPVYLDGGSGQLIEACAGLLDGDSPAACARKEAEEETGYRLARLRHLFDAYMSPGSMTERLSFFVGFYDPDDRISDGGGLAHEGEDIEVLELPFSTALDMVASGRIVDAKTIMLLQATALAGIFAR